MGGALAFDLAPGLCGWCAGDGLGVPTAGAFRLPDCGSNLGILVCDLEDRITALDREFDPDFLMYESPLLMKHDNLLTLRQIYSLGATVERFAIRKAQRTGRDIGCGECDPKRAKMALAGAAYATKPMMVKAARAFGISLPATIEAGCQDAADACGVWLYTMRKWSPTAWAAWDVRAKQLHGGLI